MDMLRSQGDRILGWCSVAAGGVALVLGWVGVSGTPFPAEQLSFIASGGLAGIFLLGLGALVLLSADLRDEWIALERIEKALSRQPSDEPQGTSGGQEAEPTTELATLGSQT